MSNLWLKIKVWTKITLFAAALLYLLFFIIENANKPVTIWVWFGHEPETTLLKLIPSLLVAGVIGTLLVKMVITTIRQVRDMRTRSQAAQFQQDIADVKAKAAMLQTKDKIVSTPPDPLTPA